MLFSCRQLGISFSGQKNLIGGFKRFADDTKEDVLERSVWSSK
jgi:hypothetical protein